MYAIVSDGAHQYKVHEGLMFEVQRKDLPEGTKSIEFDRVLMVGDVDGGAKIGTPTVPGAKVTASVVGEIKGDKVIIQKFRRRKGYSVKTGHRQRYLQVKVDKIVL
ncbi:MAG: 50S ribosomal protein L21 [Phycisphaerae bacterium]|nr:50S ribosomal protein L21 [Phycisphaerae bacterium]